MSLIEANRNFLLAPLQVAIGMVEARHVAPILSCALIEIEAGKMAVTATDGVMQTTIEADVPGAKDARVTVLACKLIDILRVIQTDATVVLDLQGARLRIVSGDSKFSLQTMPAEDFPKMVTATETASEVRLTERQLKQMFARTQAAMAVHDVRYHLRGALLSLRPDLFVIAATDGYQLAVAKLPIDVSAPPMAAILPRKAVLELFRLLADSDDPVVVKMSPKMVSFGFSRINVVANVLDGQFPDFDRIIQANCKGHFCIERRRLQMALARVAVLVSTLSGVRWRLAEECLHVEARNDAAEEAQETLPVAYAGEEIDLGYNVNYVQGALTGAQSEDVELAFSDKGAMHVTIPGRDDFTHVIMTMKI